MKRSAILLICVCATSLAPVAQNKDVHLQLTTSAKTPLEGALVGKARCDHDGNLYVRVAGAGDRENSALPIRKITPDGRLAATFTLANVVPNVRTMDFFVTNEGKVYEEAWTKSGSEFVFTFSSDGSLLAKVELDADAFVPYQIGVFDSGRFLLSGTRANPGGRHHTPFTAVFDLSGQIVKQVYEPEDDNMRQRAEAGDRDFVTESGTSNSSVYEGDAALGSDGNIYLLRAVSPALVYVVSSKGEVIRKLQVESPKPGLVAQRIRSASGNLAISFLEKNSTAGTTEVVDLHGKMIAEYTSDDERVYPGLPGCYTRSGFTFVNDDGSNVFLYKAEPK